MTTAFATCGANSCRTRALWPSLWGPDALHQVRDDLRPSMLRLAWRTPVPSGVQVRAAQQGDPHPAEPR